MNIKQFVDDAGKEFDKKFFTDDGDYSWVANDIRGTTVKDHHVFKLRELIGEVRKEVEGMKINPTADTTGTFSGTWNEGHRYGKNAALDSVLHLLDEAGGGK